MSDYSWAQFLQASRQQAAQCDEPEELLERLVRGLRRVPLDDEELGARFQQLKDHNTEGYQAEVVLLNESCQVMLIHLQPQAFVGLHNHPKQGGFIYCCRGSVLVEAFDELSATTSEAVLNKVYSTKVEQCGSARLTPTVGNIHSLQSEAETLLIDLFIPPLQAENEHLCRRYKLKEQLTAHHYRADIIPRS